MGTSHGDNERLLAPQLTDLNAIDAAVQSGGDSLEALRMAVGNDMLGPHRFGKIFPDLPPFRPADDDLSALAETMHDDPADPKDPKSAARDSKIPAGFTYLGQFIDHDLTLDQTDGFPIISNPDELHDARTVTLDLDNVYGLGPVLQPELYDLSHGPERAHFLIGQTQGKATDHPDGQAPIPVSLPNDLPRLQPSRTPLIADARDDENLIVAQTHLAFLKFHNRVMDTLPAQDDDDDGEGDHGRDRSAGLAKAQFTKVEQLTHKTPFHRAMRLVRWHYQWIVLHDHLRRILDPTVLDDVLQHGRKFYKYEGHPFHGVPFMPLEWSVAAYRLGHSMVREGYAQNRVFNGGTPPPFGVATLTRLFRFTGHGGLAESGSTNPVLPTNWVIDWNRWYQFVPNQLPQNVARKIDTGITLTLHNLPADIPGAHQPPLSLPVRNLLRGSRVGLPTGQAVADAMGIARLSPAQVAGDKKAVHDLGFDTQTPLWYYILREAELQGDGERLGQMGSRIVAEVFVGILQADKTSFLSQNPHWKPTLPAATPGTFTMVDMLKFVNDVNPLG